MVEASKYNSKKAFEQGCRSAYHAALRIGIIGDLFVNQHTTWTEAEIRAKAALCRCKKDFEQRFGGGYNAARRMGIIDELFVNSYLNWPIEAVVAEAAKYGSKAEFYRGSYSAYGAALRYKIIDDLFDNKSNASDNDTVYIWRVVDQYFNGDPVYKIGVTSERLGTKRVEHVAREAGFEYVLICCEPVTCRATDLEKRLHLLGRDPQFVGFGGATEFRAMSDTVLWAALGLISEVTVRKP